MMMLPGRMSGGGPGLLAGCATPLVTQRAAAQTAQPTQAVSPAAQATVTSLRMAAAAPLQVTLTTRATMGTRGWGGWLRSIEGPGILGPGQHHGGSEEERRGWRLPLPLGGVPLGPGRSKRMQRWRQRGRGQAMAGVVDTAVAVAEVELVLTPLRVHWQVLRPQQWRVARGVTPAPAHWQEAKRGTLQRSGRGWQSTERRRRSGGEEGASVCVCGGGVGKGCACCSEFHVGSIQPAFPRPQQPPRRTQLARRCCTLRWLKASPRVRTAAHSFMPPSLTPCHAAPPISASSATSESCPAPP